MEYVFSLNDGRKAVIYEEGNIIYLLLIGDGRNVQWSILSKDYGYDLSGYYYHEKIYISYVTIGNELAFSEVGKEERTVLYSAGGQGVEILNSQIFLLNDVLYVIFQIRNLITKEYEIKYICPESIRKNYVLFNSEKQIEKLDFYKMNNLMYVNYSLYGEEEEKIYSIKHDNERLNLSDECIVCNKKEINNDSMQRERIYNEKINEMEKKYSELVDLTKGIQEEGKKWREMYYKSVNKN